MEEKGIGRPATYAPTILTLLNREYMKKNAKALEPTELGIAVTHFLEQYFPDIMNISFTAKMEDALDGIEDGNVEWQSVIRRFYTGFEKEVISAYRESKKVALPVVESDVICEKCGAKMVIREGKFAKFLACPNYPTCKNIKSLTETASPVCHCPICSHDVMEKRSKRGKIFYGCSNYPSCTFASWDKPTDRKCPNCNSYLVVKEGKKSNTYKCSSCDYTIKEEHKADENVSEQIEEKKE